MDNNTKRNLQNALDASKRRLKDLEDEYKTAVVEQYQDCLNENIQIEKANIAALEEKLEEIRKEKVDKIKDTFDEYKKSEQEKRLQENKVNISFNNFEYASLLLFDVLHQENMQILYSLMKKEDADRLMKGWEDNINKIFKNYLAIKRG